MGAPDLNLRRAGSSDAAEIAALARRAYAKWVPVLGREPRPMVEDYDAMLTDHRIDLHEVDGALVASIATKLREDDLFVESVAVDPDWQGKGLGPRLLTHAENLASEAGLHVVRLLTNSKMAANVALYQRLGYTIFEREEHPQYGLIIHLEKRS